MRASRYATSRSEASKCSNDGAVNAIEPRTCPTPVSFMCLRWSLSGMSTATSSMCDKFYPLHSLRRDYRPQRGCLGKIPGGTVLTCNHCGARQAVSNARLDECHHVLPNEPARRNDQ